MITEAERYGYYKKYLAALLMEVMLLLAGAASLFFVVTGLVLGLSGWSFILAFVLGSVTCLITFSIGATITYIETEDGIENRRVYYKEKMNA